MKPLDFEEIDLVENSSEWNDFVLKSPQGSPFCLSGYLHQVSKKTKVFVIRDKGGDIKLGLPMPIDIFGFNSSPILTKYSALMFFSKPQSMSLAKYESSCEGLLLKALVFLKKYRTFGYSIHPSFKNALPFYWDKSYDIDAQFTHIIDNISDHEATVSMYHSSNRRDVLRAGRDGYIIREDVSIDELYEGVRATFLRQGGEPPFSLELIKNIDHAINQSNDSGVRFVKLGVTSPEGELLAVAGLLCDPKCAYLLLNGVSVGSNKIANLFLISESSKIASK
jgi:hypothetical protein